MYRVKLKGTDIKHSDREVQDGFLQQCINMQWRDESFKPIPERLVSDIDVQNYAEIIFHKVGDEDKINVLGFRKSINGNSFFLVFDLAEYLAGGTSEGSVLEWFGTITNGVFQSRTAVQIPIVKTSGMSFTILNGLIYFMGDGSTQSERYYYRVQFNESTSLYEVKNMYAWKSLVPFYPFQNNVELSFKKKGYNAYSRCGMILVRFSLVLNSGEEVLHSPVYGYILNGINTSDTQIKKDDLVTNIHTLINLNFSFADENLYKDEIAAINIYATTPFYEDKFPVDLSNKFAPVYIMSDETVKAQFQIKSEENFYLIKTIDKPSEEKILLTVGRFDPLISIPGTYSRIDISSIAAGEIMPVDNFSYHKLYGKITSYNGRLIVKRPVTVLSGGHIRALAKENSEQNQTYRIETEDGVISGIPEITDKALGLTTVMGGLITQVHSRGLLSYPDTRASHAGFVPDGIIARYLYKLRANKAHNLSCAFNISATESSVWITESGADIKLTSNYCIEVIYSTDGAVMLIPESDSDKYSSENRIQFSQTGEFSVWPAINSYRIGEGKIMGVGNNSLNPGNAEVIAPLIVGTSEGTYTINLDPMGNNFISSITKTANVPYISEETLQIEGYLLFVSDKGLMAIQNGDIVNLTKDFFPDQGNGDFPEMESVFEGYNLLTADFMPGVSYNPDDVVRYMKGALLAYDGRRDNIWCSNPAYNYSMVFNVPTKLWSFSTIVFSKKVEYFALSDSSEGDIYTRFMLIDKTGTKLYLLSGEDKTKEVDILIFTRPIKFDYPDNYKEISRMSVRTVLVRDTTDGYLALGLWGKQDLNKYKKSIPIAAKKDNREEVFPLNVRQDIPVSVRKGKYKSVNVLVAGKVLPDSYIASLDFEVGVVDEKRMR